MKANICVIGAGHAGLVTAACLAELGNQITCVEIDRRKVRQLRNGILPFCEPGLDELVHLHRESGRLQISNTYDERVRNSQFVFICVGTPCSSTGRPDLRHLWQAARSIREQITRNTIVVNKSTVPVGTAERLAQVIDSSRCQHQGPAVVANPEFLAEGSAVQDFQQPDMVILGSTNLEAAKAVARLYEPYNCTTIITDPRTAEMTKYAINSFLATKISFVNELANLCERLGADIKTVSRALGSHRRIGGAYMEAGMGWGGGCLPKDVTTLKYMARACGFRPRILEAVEQVNQAQRQIVVHKLRNMLGSLENRTVGILGLSFKPGSDDMRAAPSLDIIRCLQEEGCHVRAYDPAAMEKASQLLVGVTFCVDPYQLAYNCDALILTTGWSEFQEVDLPRIRSAMKAPFFVDGRNLFDPLEMERAGFIYDGVGRGSLTKPTLHGSPLAGLRFSEPPEKKNRLTQCSTE